MKPGGKPLARRVNLYAADLQATVACVANGAVRVTCEPGILQSGRPGYKLTLMPLELRVPVDAESVSFFFGQLVEPDESRNVHGFTVTQYWYQLLDSSDVARLRWEWDPAQDPPWPHLHVDKLDHMSGDGPPRLLDRQINKLHLATGRVLLEDILGMLMRDRIIEPDDPERTHAAIATSLVWAKDASWGSLRS